MGDLLLIDSNSITILDLKERRFAANEIESLYMEKEQIWARLRGSIIGFSAGCLAGLAYELATRGRYTYGINWWGSSNWNKDNPDWRVIPAAGFTGGGIGSFIGSLFNGYREIPLDELFESNLKLASKYNLQVERFQLTASVIF